MPRTGRHPLKERNLVLKEPVIASITITTITHIPMLSGYWQESLEVLRLFFDSLLASTGLDFDLLVFDNASCHEVTDYLTQLKEEGVIQYLLLSDRNFRKLGALDFMLRAAPGEFVAYSDSDVYFLPGWLEQSLEVLKAFPQTGMVSALPTIDKANIYIQSTRKGIARAEGLLVETGTDLIPQAFIQAHQTSLGKSEAEYYSGSRQDTRVTFQGTSAYLSAQDFQFLTTKDVIRQVLPLRVEEGAEDYDPIYSPVFEAKIDRAGYWRLSTADYLVHHMGNSVPDLAEELKEIAPGLDFSEKVAEKADSKTKLVCRFYNSHRGRKMLKKIYTWSYRKLFEE